MIKSDFKMHTIYIIYRYNWDFISDFVLLYLQICEIESIYVLI